MKKKIFIISLLLFVCFLITGNDAFAVTVYNETDFRNALSQRQSTITIQNSIDFYSAITIDYNVTINAGTNDNALRCRNKVANFITVNNGCTLTLAGIVVDVRGNQGSAGITGIRIPYGGRMVFQGSLIDGGMSNTGLLIESGGAVTVTRGDFVYSKYGIRVIGNGTLTHTNSSSMNFWNNELGLLYESTATCTMPNSKFYKNTTAMQVSNGTVNLQGGGIYENSYGVVAAGGTFNHTGAGIYNNTYHGVIVRNGTYNLAGGAVQTNKSQGVVLESGSTGVFKMTSGTISGNTYNAVYNAQSGDNCIIHGGTVSGWVYLALTDNYVTTNTSYPTLSVKPSSYSFKRKLVKTNSNAYANNEIGKVTMAASGSWYKYVDGQYIVVWTGGNVIVKCVDLGNNAVLSTETKNGTIGTNVTLTDPAVSGYALVSRPSTTTYTYAQADQTATYGFRKISNLVINYIDANTKEVIVSQTVELKEGDSYTATVRDIPGYENTLKPTNETITMGRIDTELVYEYKKISKGVDVKYIDQVTGDELASEHLDGLEKDGYTTAAKDIEGYELVKTPDNANGEMAADLTTVTYEYRKISYVIVRYVDINKNTDLTTPISTKYKEGDAYTSSEKDIFGYELIGTTDNTSGTVVRENIEVLYKYKKTSDGVYISYVDQVTGDELAETIHIDGLEQDPYTSEAKEIDGYELVVTPTNKEGVLVVGRLDVVYEYRKNSYVTTKYIDENYGTNIVEDVVTKYKEGDAYTTEEKQLGGYELTGKTDNTSGTVVRDDIAVEYRYKKISQGVDIKHIDQVTGDELASEHIDGLEKDGYTTSPKTIDGYELVKTPDNKDGEMVVDLTTVTYEYRKNSNVIVKYIDENYGTNIIEDVVTKYKEGDSYTTEEKSFDGYELTDKTDNLSGTVVRDDIVVIYEYKKISQGVDIKYIDQATGLSIADTVHFGGLEKDAYTTTPKDIDDYELVFTSDNANGELAVDLITVVYEYRMLSNVTTKFIDENYGTEITEAVVETYKEGDPYSTRAKSFDGYNLTGKTDNTNGTVAREDIVVEYKYKKISEGVDTKYIDQVTGAEIATPVHQDGLEKDGYTTTPKDIAGYELVLTPDNADGEMAVALTTVTYEYRLVSKVTTKYIDVNSRTQIVTAVEVEYKEGDPYTTEEKTFEGYQLVNKSDNTTGTMGRNNIEVTYEYKKISEGIEVVFIDQVTGNPIAASVVKTGLEYQEYTTEAKVVDGYELVLIPTNATGRMTVGKITVKYEYRKLSDIVTKYVDVNYNQEISEQEKQTLKEGDFYTTTLKNLDGYQLVNDPENKTGVLVRENIEVVYEYKKISDGVDVKYVDQVTGEEIADTEHKDGLEKDNYSTEPKEIKGYELVKTPTNKNGEMTVDKITVTYEYRLVSKVITKHIDANTGKEIVDAVENEYKEGDTYTTLPKDLVGYVITKTPENTTGTIGRETIEVVYEYKKISDGLVAKYIDEITGDVMETETYTGNEDDMIELEEKSYEGYILTKRPAVSEIKLTVEPQEVRFYYKKLIDINIIAIDGITGEEIYTKVQTGVEGEAYETKPVILPGYEISKTPDNATGTYTRDDVNVIYEYKRISEGVIVTYVDKDTREVLDTQTITGFVGEEYSTEKNTYEKYDYVEVIGNPKGKLEIDQIEVTYLYTKKTGIVEIVYADEEGNELLKEELTGRVDEDYVIEIKDINNYRIKEVVGETEGQYTVEKQIVKFVMEKLRGKVIVNLLDQNGNLIGQIEEEDFVGEIFNVELPEKEGYYIDGENKVTVEYIDGEIIVNVNYIKIEEPPATGDINVMVYLIAALTSMILIGKITLKNSKN
ncbi:MAG: MucBP domain-containing protein [Clostridia bacterium]|nr:MucBP domain-containing protein [Clostridia bacterium]